MRSHGIISQLTPPYMPQHNSVTERRNRSLLNMVQSMMSLTTLPMSFWGYGLESIARILNMVPTKKVNKTPYEIWHGKVPNLSYLKNSLISQEESGNVGIKSLLMFFGLLLLLFVVSSAQDCSAEVNAASENMLEVTTAREYQVNVAS
ncbi:retrotransposon protein, putative, ty1-copia subclass [Tanacetum coccineum]